MDLYLSCCYHSKGIVEWDDLDFDIKSAWSNVVKAKIADWSILMLDYYFIVKHIFSDDPESISVSRPLQEIIIVLRLAILLHVV